MIRRIVVASLVVSLIVGGTAMSSPQSESEVHAFLRDSVRLSPAEIADVRSGKGVAKALESRKPSEIFVFGATFINAPPESYVKLTTDIERLRKLSEYQAVGKFGEPPQVSDLTGFTFDKEDIEALKKCKPGDCDIQMPSGPMLQVQKGIDWSSPNVGQQVNQALHRAVVERLLAYQKSGNRALGEYNDRQHPTMVARQFAEILSFSQAMPRYTPALHRYLLEYPNARPAGVQEIIRWEKVKFGLKPTLRVIHVIVARGNGPSEPAYVVVGKQLYASHYFETALDLAFCVPSDDPKRPGFYLMMLMGSEQEGLTGFRGSILRKVAVSRTASGLEKSLKGIKAALEGANGVAR